MRPAWFGPHVGFTAENVAHRIAVEYEDETGKTVHGVFIPERHTSSVLASTVGTMVLPGVYKKGEFEVEETDSTFRVSMKSKGLSTEVEATLSDDWQSSFFGSVDEASAYYHDGSVAWSPSPNGERLESLELTTERWEVEPVKVTHLTSEFYDALPAGTVEFDHAVIMRNIPAIWGYSTHKSSS